MKDGRQCDATSEERYSPELRKGRRGFQNLEIHEDDRCGSNRHQRQRQMNRKAPKIRKAPQRYQGEGDDCVDSPIARVERIDRRLPRN